MTTIQKARELVGQDHQFALQTDHKAHAAALKAVDGFFEASKVPHDHDHEVNCPVGDFINSTIEQTGTFTLAQAVVDELTQLTDSINKSLDETKPLFGKVSPENQHKAEILRSVAMAHYLKVAFDELQKLNQKEV